MLYAGVTQQQEVNRVTGPATTITYVGGYVVSGATASTLTMILPVDYEADDFGIIYWYTGDNDLWNSSVTQSWVLDREQDYNASGGNNDMVSAIWTKKLGATETDPEVTNDGNKVHAAALLVFRGVDTTTPFDNVTESYAWQTGSVVIDPATITPEGAGTMLVLMGGITQSTVSAASVMSTPSNATMGPSNAASQNDRTIVTAYAGHAPAGTEIDPSGFVLTDSATNDNKIGSQAFCYALRAAT